MQNSSLKISDLNHRLEDLYYQHEECSNLGDHDDAASVLKEIMETELALCRLTTDAFFAEVPF